jgi:regulatory protein
MEMSCIKKEEGFGRLLILLLDGEPWREVHCAIFGRKPHLPTHCDTQESLQEWFEQVEYQGALVFTLKKLTVKSRLREELRTQLEEHLVSEATIVNVLQRCAELGYLNDAAYAEQFVRSRIAKKLGPHAIKMQLRQKGFSESNIHALLAESQHPGAERERIQELIQSRYCKHNLADPKARKKVIASLVRKGFSLNEIFAVLNKSFLN